MNGLSVAIQHIFRLHYREVMVCRRTSWPTRAVCCEREVIPVMMRNTATARSASMGSLEWNVKRDRDGGEDEPLFHGITGVSRPLSGWTAVPGIGSPEGGRRGAGLSGIHPSSNLWDRTQIATVYLFASMGKMPSPFLRFDV